MPAQPDIGSLRHRLYFEDALGNLIATRWAAVEDKPGLPVQMTIRYLPVLSFAHRLRLGTQNDLPDLTALEMGTLTAADYAAMAGDVADPPRYFRVGDIDNELFRRVYQVIDAIAFPPLIHKITLQAPTRSASAKTGEVVIAWNDVRPMWANLKPVSAVDQGNYAQTLSLATHTLTVMYGADITPDSRFTYNGRHFNIVSALNVDETSIETTLSVREVL